MNIFQERKYDAVDGRLVNRETGKPIPNDEPVMIFRAKDRKALNALEAYQFACTDETHRQVIQGRIDDFREFQTANPDLVKEPDSDPSCLKP